MYKSIALVDVSCLFKRTFEANPSQGGTNTLAELVRIRERVEHMVLCLDAPPYARKERFAGYKANRSAPEASELYQKRWLYDRCKEMGLSIARHKGAEGDDVIATLARIYGESCPDVWLVGADKDLAQCVTDNVRQLIPQHGERAEHFRGPKEVKEKYGVTPAQMPLWLALVGDKGDNVPGVKGIGQVKAAGLIGEYKTLTGIAESLTSIGGQIGAALAAGWEQLVLSLELVTLDAHLPLDAEGLLEKGVPVITTEMVPAEFDGFMGNETPMPEPVHDENLQDRVMLAGDAAPAPKPLIGKDPRADEFMRQEAAARESRRNADRAAEEQQKAERQSEHPDFPKWPDPDFRPVQEPTRLTAELNGSERRERERALREAAAAPKVTEAEFDPIGKSPGASGPMPPLPQVTNAKVADMPAATIKPGLAKTRPEPTEYGLVTEDLQPRDLRSAEVIAKWLFGSNLYPQFKSPQAIFAVIARGKELGMGMTTALSGFHVVEGKPSASADLIRALAKRSPKCKYFRLVHSDATKATWETWHKDDPDPTPYTYTIEEARQAGLNSGNWVKRPRDMLTKTAGSKLARLVYPEETQGLYCPEEMGDYVDTVGEAA